MWQGKSLWVCIVMSLFISLSVFADNPNFAAYWNLNGTSGTAYDSVGTNNGTLNGDADWSTSGKIDGCIGLDGDGDYIQINNTNDEPVIPEGSTFTISAWIDANDVAGYRYIYGYCSNYSTTSNAYVMYLYNGDFDFYLGNGTEPQPGCSDLDAGSNITTNQWYHLAVVYDGNYLYGYVDGELRKTVTITLAGTLPMAGSGDMYELIGGGYSGPYRNFDGLIDNVKVWTRPLSSEEIEQEYDTDFVAYWNLNETSGSTAYDSLGTNNGTRVGDADWSTSGKIEGCVKLDGDGDYIQINATNDAPVIPEGSEFTISVWIDANDVTGDRYIYGYGSSSMLSYRAYEIWLSNGKFLFSIGNGNETQTCTALDLDNKSLILNRWYHLAVVFDGSSLHSYMDGEYRKSVAITLTGTFPKVGIGNTYELIGGGLSGPYKNYAGRIDEIKVWTRPLSSAELLQEYENGFGIKSGEIDVTEDPYYAAGDGQTDDSSAIQQAIDDSNSSGKTILLKDGRFLVNSLIHLKPFTDMKGENGVLLSGSSVADGSTLLTVDNKCDVYDLEIDGNGKNLHLVTLEKYTKEVELNNITVHNLRGTQQTEAGPHPYGVWMKDYCKNVHVDESEFYDISILGFSEASNAWCRGVLVEEANDIIIENSLFYNIKSDSGFDADCIHVATTRLSDNNWVPSYVTIQNCELYDFSWRAIKLQCSNAVVNGNYISAVNPRTGIELFGSDITVSNNKIFLDIPQFQAGIIGGRGNISTGIGARSSDITGNTVEVTMLYSENPHSNKLPYFATDPNYYLEDTFGIYLSYTNNISVNDNYLKVDDGLCFYNNTNCFYQDNVVVSEPYIILWNSLDPGSVLSPNILPWGNPSTSYIAGDSVLSIANDVYECIFSHSNQEPPNSTYWDFVEHVDFSVNKVHNSTNCRWYSSIQSAINDANDFDEIVVYPGTYTESIDFLGKSITVRSIDPNDWDFVVATIIDANSLADHVVTFDTGEDANSILSGFTITGGYADGTSPGNRGAGIYCYQTSPTIEHCLIADNYAAEHGGGLYTAYGSPAIADCNFVENQAGDSGGGMRVYEGTPIISGCDFQSNISPLYGGGIGIYSADPLITNCYFTLNDSERGGAVSIESYSGPEISGCSFYQNTAYHAGGIYSLYSAPSIYNCIFQENVVDASGGAMQNSISSILLKNSVFLANEAKWGGAMHNDNSSPIITNCTFTQNEAIYNSGGGQGGAMRNYNNSDPVITNCILWGNLASVSYPEISNASTSDVPVVSFSDVEGSGGSTNWDSTLGTDGGGNIDSDPNFVEDYLLISISPCIDAGNDDPNVVYTGQMDIEGDNRVIDGNRDSVDRVDMGADEYNAFIAYWKLDETSGSTAEDCVGGSHGSLINFPTDDSQWVTDQGHNALEFDGYNDYVQVPFILDPNEGSFSAFAWVKSGEISQTILAQVNDGNGGIGRSWLTIEANGYLCTVINDGSFPNNLLISSTTITDGGWHHVGVVWDYDPITSTGYRRLYLDGAPLLSDTTPIGNLESSEGGMHIGCSKNVDSFWDGLIDDVRIYKRALDSTEITELYKSGQ